MSAMGLPLPWRGGLGRGGAGEFTTAPRSPTSRKGPLRDATTPIPPEGRAGPVRPARSGAPSVADARDPPVLRPEVDGPVQGPGPRVPRPALVLPVRLSGGRGRQVRRQRLRLADLVRRPQPGADLLQRGAEERLPELLPAVDSPRARPPAARGGQD